LPQWILLAEIVLLQLRSCDETGGDEVLNTLTTFEKFIQEHEVIRVNTHQILNAAENLMTLYRLQNSPAQFTSYQIEILNDRRLNLKRSLGSLKDGLRDHHEREEEMMRPMVGEPLLRVIRQEHRKLIEKISEVDWILLNVGPIGIFYNSQFINQKIDALCRGVSVINRREDSILEMLLESEEA